MTSNLRTFAAHTLQAMFRNAGRPIKLLFREPTAEEERDMAEATLALSAGAASAYSSPAAAAPRAPAVNHTPYGSVGSGGSTPGSHVSGSELPPGSLEQAGAGTGWILHEREKRLAKIKAKEKERARKKQQKKARPAV